MADQFDVTIIGSGPGGYVAAIRGSQMGLKVALVEKEDGGRLGGTCGLRGCIPTKALLNAAHLYQKAGHFEDFGLSVDNLSYDWSKVQDYKSGVVSKNSAGVSYLMKKNKVTVFNGFGKIAGKGKVEVALSDAKKRNDQHKKNIIIATGFCRSPNSWFLKTDGKTGCKIPIHILELEKSAKNQWVVESVFGSGRCRIRIGFMRGFGCENNGCRIDG